MTTTRKRPESLRLTHIAPSLTVNDMEASLAFYRDLLGFHPKEIWTDDDGTAVGAELVAGSQVLMLTRDDGRKGRDRTKGVGMRFFFLTNQRVDDIAEAVRERGGTLLSEPADREWGARTFDVQDPDGFQITVSSPPV